MDDTLCVYIRISKPPNRMTRWTLCLGGGSNQGNNTWVAMPPPPHEPVRITLRGATNDGQEERCCHGSSHRSNSNTASNDMFQCTWIVGFIDSDSAEQFKSVVRGATASIAAATVVAAAANNEDVLSAPSATSRTATRGPDWVLEVIWRLVGSGVLSTGTRSFWKAVRNVEEHRARMLDGTGQS